MAEDSSTGLHQLTDQFPDFGRKYSGLNKLLLCLQRWDPSLKVIAEGYAAKCIWNHNPELEDTGENLFAGTGPLDLREALEKWFLGESVHPAAGFVCRSGLCSSWSCSTSDSRARLFHYALCFSFSVLVFVHAVTLSYVTETLEPNRAVIIPTMTSQNVCGGKGRLLLFFFAFCSFECFFPYFCL